MVEFGAVKNKVTVELLTARERENWDNYVQGHPQATLAHLSGWKDIIEAAYGHPTYYLLAKRRLAHNGEEVAGILPLVHLRHLVFGNHLISMPYLDTGGALAEDSRIAEALGAEAVEIGRSLKVDDIELRCRAGHHRLQNGTRRQDQKVSLLLDLPASPDTLWDSFKSKLRSQIRKPLKQGLEKKIGGAELLPHFYEVFARNMRDLGSPVHSRGLLERVLSTFGPQARLILIYRGRKPVAGGLLIRAGKVLANPWASSLREYSALSPNMLLYWAMLEYGCNQGGAAFDMGRSSPGEGTYRFKKQWGAREVPLEWQYIRLGSALPGAGVEKNRYRKVMQYWQKMPVPLSKMLGPMVRKHIGL